MPGDRQRQIIAALEAGPWSLEALIQRLGDKRALIQASLQRLERAGRIRIRGKLGKRVSGAMVELVPERDRSLARSAPRRRPSTDLQAIAERWAR